MKCIILSAEVATCYLLLRILEKLSLPKELCFLYILNPLVITELTGNAHFDGLMIFFIMLAFFLLLKNNLYVSAVALSFGIAAKLLPVLFIPLIIKRCGWKKGIGYSIIAGIITLTLFALVFNVSMVQHMLKSVDLFIRNFEFNASVYYVVRYFGRLITGYNIIAAAGPALILLASILILFISFKRKIISDFDLFKIPLFVISIWFLFSTTVHPWYICMPVAMAVFTPYRFAIIWSFTATLSYAAYQTVPVKENLWLVGAGYIVVIGYCFMEMQKKTKSFYP